MKAKTVDRLIRWGIWLSVLLFAFWVADIVARPDKTKKTEAAMFQLKTDIQRVWIGETPLVDELNREARAVIAEKGLSPGDPLPPKTFFQKGDLFREALDKTDAVQILRTYTLYAEPWKTWVWVTFGVRNTVPEPGEPYAVVCLCGDASLIKHAMMLHPKAKSTLSQIQFAEGEMERKGNRMRNRMRNPERIGVD